MDPENISHSSLSSVKQTIAALDLQYPSEAFPNARKMKRKFFLHVGPTNSGKTYNALRALAGARNGAYAGPLRLLAHEVWARLNQGSIRPFDADPSTANDYVRQCNLVTGEEIRMVSPDAPLISCTVEMLNLFQHHHVVVIDEIQMIADPSRGGAWTAAVLGVCADEIHLCGEEAAVPLIQALVRETNDELVINRYTRLTPLAVASQSLRNDWKSIKKGDCVVTFSRKQIFHLKAVVEKETGLRCAVVYGRLPSETRSEQAALFNHGDSGYDVLIASDAIGMGLNLKINRIVFVDMRKSNGKSLQYLSLSQLKQIGGRAGRFGAGAGDVGIVTCMHQQNIPTLREAFDMEPPVLAQATIPLQIAIFAGLAEVLPSHFGLLDFINMIGVAGRLGDHYSLPVHDAPSVGMSIIDSIGKTLLLSEKLQFMNCPVSWRNEAEVGIVSDYLSYYASGKEVDLEACLEQTLLLDTLHKIDADRIENSGESDLQTSEMLSVLETLHKVLLSYIWLSYRIPASFHQYEEAAKLKETTERCIEFVLEGIEDIDKKSARLLKKASQLRAETSADKIQYDIARKKVQKKVERLAASQV
ncbi:P-loop containing nucleoside triphosphate hydrolase protein [Hysterangium stoloniferum]|nr:P-loop containing nucleoside triphosphate hydrolase protein [Hysterangium stoloniferum]